MTTAQLGISLIPLALVSLGAWFYVQRRRPRPVTMRSLWALTPFTLLFVGTAWAYAIRQGGAGAYLAALIVTVVWTAAFVVGYRKRRDAG